MHAKRWLTSIVALPFVIWLIWKGATPFFLLISAVAMVSLREYFFIVFHDKLMHPAIVPVGMILGLAMIAAAHLGLPQLVLCLLAIDVLCLAGISVWRSRPGFPLLNAVCIQIQGMIYIPLLLAFLVMMRHQPYGLTWVFYLLCIIFSGDSGAYYVGTYWGKHKLNPRVSPGKTVEGALGGLAANIAFGAAINFFADCLPWGLAMPKLPWGWAVLFFIVVGATGQLGDLFESQLKRAANVKDSGKILPGHGGMLDRIDALLFAAPVAYIFKEYVFG
jgi:phosphatidate cytidylyltransferase